jgi:hypothetical protein
MRAHARPRPVFRLADELRANRVQTDITYRSHEMALIHDDGSEAALKQVTGPASARIDEMGVAPVGGAPIARASPLSSFGTRMRWTWLGIRQ